MQPIGDDVTFELRYRQYDASESGGLIGSGALILPLSVGLDVVLDMAPSLIFRETLISERALLDLRRRNMLSEANVRQRKIVLRELRIVGQRVPDLEVRRSQLPDALRVDGFLGLDFLGRFATVRYDTATHRVTLSRSTG